MSATPDAALAALLARVEQAVESASRLQTESELLIGISEALREGKLTSRCAWCGRFHVRDRWVVVEHMPELMVFPGTTHTICDDCVDLLRESGKSV